MYTNASLKHSTAPYPTTEYSVNTCFTKYLKGLSVHIENDPIELNGQAFSFRICGRGNGTLNGHGNGKGFHLFRKANFETLEKVA